MQYPMTICAITVTIFSYFIGRYISSRFQHPLANIILISTTCVIAVLLITGHSYTDYTPAMEIMTYPLGAATVALAVPVYKNRTLLQQYAGPILFAVVIGSLLSMIAAMSIAKLGGLNKVIIASIAPKSATIPFALEVARIGGGQPALTAAFVVATGSFGAIFGLTLLNKFKIHNPAIRGMVLGMVSHGQGAALALTEGEIEGAMAGVAMALTGIVTAITAPYLIPLFL